MTAQRSAYAELRYQVRAAYLDAVDHRDRASRDDSEAGRVRAVAHQTCASRLLRILDATPDLQTLVEVSQGAGQVADFPASYEPGCQVCESVLDDNELKQNRLDGLADA